MVIQGWQWFHIVTRASPSHLAYHFLSNPVTPRGHTPQGYRGKVGKSLFLPSWTRLAQGLRFAKDMPTSLPTLPTLLSLLGFLGGKIYKGVGGVGSVGSVGGAW